MLVLILAPYPPKNSPSQRFRFEHYLDEAEKHDIKFTYCSFSDINTWKIIFDKGKHFAKIIGICKGFIKRFLLLFGITKYDFVYIHREAAPIGPPIFEWIIAKLFRRKIIYDFDDAIWVKTSSKANPGVGWLKCTWKIKYICRYSYIVTVGNDYLADYARQYCKNVKVIPTVVDTINIHNKMKDQNETPLTIGWTGTFTNFYNLQRVVPTLDRLKEKYSLDFLIIADKDPKFNISNYSYIKWNALTEISDLRKIHIGLMPLDNSIVELGKCGFKAIQYMSLGIPAVVSPVGVNCKIVDDTIDGFWADSDAEWYEKLEKLIIDVKLRTSMGIAARKKVILNYSVEHTVTDFFDLFKEPSS